MPKITANGLTLHVQRAGDSGPDVVLIHGVTGDLSIWFLCQAMQELGKTHRVTAFDLRGHGYSAVPPSGYTSVDQALNIEVLPDKATAAKDLGILNMANSGGQLIGPIIAASIFAGTGSYRWVFLVAMVLLVASAALIHPIKKAR